MKRQNYFLKTCQMELLAGNKSEGFILMAMIPVFLAILSFATAMAGCISCSIHAMAHRNEMIQAYSLLEDDETAWQDEILSAAQKNVHETNYEKIISTQKAGPYTLLVKEIRNKTTGKVLVNRQEFIPIEKEDDRKS